MHIIYITHQRFLRKENFTQKIQLMREISEVKGFQVFT